MAFYETSDVASERTRLLIKRRERALPLVVVAVLAVFAAFGTMTFYRYLDSTLFKERNSHFIELSDKVAQIIESVVVHYWSVTDVAENMLLRAELESEENIPEQLAEIRDCIDLEQGIVMAFEGSARFYSSDGAISNWRNAAVLSNNYERQDLVTLLDYRADDITYMLFIKKLDEPLSVARKRITHLGVAVDISVFRNAFDTDMFQGQSYAYVINITGRRLYKHERANNFIDSYNMLTALEECEFIHGGTIEDLRKAIINGDSVGYEFKFGEKSYFVAASAVHQTDWTILTFVPTDVLGAGTTSFMNRAVIYMAVIGILVVAMIGMVMLFFISKRSDRQLIENQRQANEMLKKAAEAANAASVAKSNFLSHMSHDIRTPINGIMGMTDIALKNLANPERVHDCLKKIEGSSGHLLSLVNDVLDMSRIESGKTKISHEPMDIRQVIEHCASIIGGQIQGRTVELVQEFEELSRPYVYGDELHLRQVLINILGNAVKFTPDGGKIYFRVRELSREEDIIVFRIEIEDTGIGMKPEFISLIFEPFAQEDDGIRSTYKGTGLGMAITKKFMDLMGGTIVVESQLNVGSKFILELPMEIDKEIRNKHVESGQEVELGGISLLLAEDNELNMEIAQYILEDVGIKVTPATNGKEALNIFAESPEGSFDGILMDVMMPIMDGLSATQAIRALDRGDAEIIPIIAMTANAYEEDKRRCMAAGMNAHVTKPIDRDELMQVLAYFIVESE